MISVSCSQLDEVLRDRVERPFRSALSPSSGVPSISQKTALRPAATQPAAQPASGPVASDFVVPSVLFEVLRVWCEIKDIKTGFNRRHKLSEKKKKKFIIFQ